MKNILILSSSPRRGGNSDTLCDRFMAGSLDKGHHVEKIFLADKHINYCTGCSVCSLYGKPCPQKDDVAELVEKMIQADVIVLATPVYFYTMSGQMKTFIDRCCARYTEISNKEFYFIATAAEGEKQLLERTGTHVRQPARLHRLPRRSCRERVPLRLRRLENGRHRRDTPPRRSLPHGCQRVR